MVKVMELADRGDAGQRHLPVGRPGKRVVTVGISGEGSSHFDPWCEGPCGLSADPPHFPGHSSHEKPLDMSIKLGTLCSPRASASSYPLTPFQLPA